MAASLAGSAAGHRAEGAGRICSRPFPTLSVNWDHDWDHDLSKDDLLDIQGVVTSIHGGGLYRVRADAGHEMLAQLSGRMRRFRIKVVTGDRVTVSVSPYDMVRGIITFRAR